MTIVGRIVWFVVGLGLVIGAMLATAHFARAMNITPYCLHRQKAKICEYPLWIYRPLPPPSPARQQMDLCYAYGHKHGRGVYTLDVKDPETKVQSDREGDWLYFCMQQARFQLIKGACTDDAENMEWDSACWVKVEPKKLPCTWGSCDAPPADRWTKER